MITHLLNKSFDRRTIVNDSDQPHTVIIRRCEFQSLMILGRFDVVSIEDCVEYKIAGEPSGLVIRARRNRSADTVLINGLTVDVSKPDLHEYPVKISAVPKATEHFSPIRSVKMERVTVVGSGEPYRANTIGGTPDQISIQGVDSVDLKDVYSILGGENGFSITQGCRDIRMTGCDASDNQGQGWHVGTHGYSVDRLLMVDTVANNNWRNSDSSPGRGVGVLLHGVIESRFENHRSGGHEFGISNINQFDHDVSMVIHGSRLTDPKPFTASPNCRVVVDGVLDV